MLNDIKFLYYLLTNYTIKEIKILFQIVYLIPEMIFKKNIAIYNLEKKKLCSRDQENGIISDG